MAEIMYNLLDQIKIKYKDKNNTIRDTILNDNKHNEKYDKLRILNLISINQRTFTNDIIHKNKELFILDKTILNKYYYYKEINDILNNVQNISSSPIDIILDELNFNKLKVIGKALSSKKEKYQNSESITLASYKTANIYKELIFIDKEQKELFNKEFNIKNYDDYDIEYKFINNNDILKISYNMILIGNLDKKTNEYNLKYLLEYNDSNNLSGHLFLLENLGIDEYFKNYISFEDGNCCYINHYNDKPGIAYKYDKNIKQYILPYISSHFYSCPNLGLTNIGATCYMNSTLQCFSHIEKFVDYFKYNSKWDKIKEHKDKYPLSLSFKELIENLWPNEIDPSKKDYAPNNFKETISKMNSLFEGIAACDAKDLVNFIVMTLHIELCDDENNQLEELTKIKINSFINNNPRDKFMKDFNKNNNTIISKLFYGVNFNKSKCTKCPKPKEIYNYQSYFFMIFPLEEVRKYKYPENIAQSTQNNLMNASLNLNISNSQPIMMNQPFYNNNQYAYNQQGFIPRALSASWNMNMIMNMNMNNYMNNQFMMPQQGAYPNNFNQYPMGMNMQNQFNNNMMSFQNQNNNYVMPGQQLPQPQPQQNQNNNNKNEVNIEDCFEYSIKENIMSGDNSMYCQQCRSNQTFKMATKIVTFPEVLIIILNRGMGLEFDVKINFDKMINLGKYIEKEKKDVNKENEVIQYDIIGVISHIGENSDAGHFIAYCRDPIKRENWHKYNDCFVTKVNDFQKEVVDFGMPYVLFYQKH